MFIGLVDNIWENFHLIQVLKETSGLSDMFGKEGSVCQAIELYRIRSGL